MYQINKTQKFILYYPILDNFCEWHEWEGLIRSLSRMIIKEHIAPYRCGSLKEGILPTIGHHPNDNCQLIVYDQDYRSVNKEVVHDAIRDYIKKHYGQRYRRPKRIGNHANYRRQPISKWGYDVKIFYPQHGRRNIHSYRVKHPQTAQEKRFSCDPDHKPYVRARRNIRNIPDAWDDGCTVKGNGWKDATKKKRQWER